MKNIISIFVLFTIFLFLIPKTIEAGYCSVGQCLSGPPAPGFKSCTSNQECVVAPPPSANNAVDFDQIENAVPGLKELSNKNLGQIIYTFIPYLFGIAGLILLLYLIWGGFSLMLSKGDQKAVEAARSRITTAITGFVIIFVAYWLVQILGLILGIEQFGQIFGK